MGDNPDFGRTRKTQKSAFAANIVTNKGELERLQKLFIEEKSTTISPACYTNEPFVVTIDVLNAV